MRSAIAGLIGGPLTCLVLGWTTPCGAAPVGRGHNVAEEIISIGFGRGLDGAVGYTLMSDGSLATFGMDMPAAGLSVSPSEVAELKGFLSSKEGQEAIRSLESSGFQPDSSDLPEVSIGLAGKEVGYPVCSGGPEVAREVLALVTKLNELGAEHLPGFSTKTFPVTTCRPGQDP